MPAVADWAAYERDGWACCLRWRRDPWRRVRFAGAICSEPPCIRSVAVCPALPDNYVQASFSILWAAYTRSAEAEWFSRGIYVFLGDKSSSVAKPVPARAGGRPQVRLRKPAGEHRPGGAMRHQSKEHPMNILAINGSPKGKHSNTWRLTSAFLEGLADRIGKQRADAGDRSPYHQCARYQALPGLLFLLEQDAGRMLYPRRYAGGHREDFMGRCHHLELPPVLFRAARTS